MNRNIAIYTCGDYKFYTRPDNKSLFYYVTGTSHTDVHREYLNRPNVQAILPYKDWKVRAVGPAEGEYGTRYLLDGDIIIDRKLVDNQSQYTVIHRTPNAHYWPTEELVKELSETIWPRKLSHELINSFYEGECRTYRDHYFRGSRRYGIKNNPIIRVAYICEVDPEGRFRRFGEVLPDYIIKGLQEADINVGRWLGIEDSYINPCEMSR